MILSYNVKKRPLNEKENILLVKNLSQFIKNNLNKPLKQSFFEQSFTW